MVYSRILYKKMVIAWLVKVLLLTRLLLIIYDFPFIFMYFKYLCLYCIFISCFQPHFFICVRYDHRHLAFFVCKGMAAIADSKHHGKAVIATIILWKPSAIMNNWVFHKIFVAITCLTAIGGCHLYRT